MPVIVAFPVVFSVATCRLPVPVALVKVTPAKELTSVTPRVDWSRVAPVTVS